MTTKRMKKKTKVEAIKPDRVLKAVLGTRYRWSGEELRRVEVMIIGKQVFLQQKVRGFEERVWRDVTSDVAFFRTRVEAQKALEKESASFYVWHEEKIVKIFKKAVRGGGFNYYIEGQTEDHWGSHWMRKADREGKLKRTRAQAVRDAIKDLRVRAKKSSQEAFATLNLIKELQKTL